MNRIIIETDDDEVISYLEDMEPDAEPAETLRTLVRQHRAMTEYITEQMPGFHICEHGHITPAADPGCAPCELGELAWAVGGYR